MRISKMIAAALLALSSIAATAATQASEFNRAWHNKQRALIIDAYEHNEFDLAEMAKDKRIAAFIHKGSDGLPARYRCTGNATEKKLCRQTWRRYVVARELYQTRRTLAKLLGMKWGAYHLARPGNPLDQARHFIDYTKPTDDEVIVLDIEDNDPEKWMSLEDAETFARYIYRRLGRWPMLYTNGSTAQFIADNKDKYEILSRLPLWYARYKPEIGGHFPKGNWESYDIWQFQAQINCNSKRCPYPVRGANKDIDVNVVDMSVEELRAAWPFDELVPEKADEADVLMVDADTAAPEPEVVVNASVSAASLASGYMQAATARGAEIIRVDVETTTAALADKKPINDLF